MKNKEYDRETQIKITRRDAEMLIDLVDNPPPPNEAMKLAFEKYKKEKEKELEQKQK